MKIFEMSGQVLVTCAFETWLLTRALTGKILVFWIGGSKQEVAHLAYKSWSHMKVMD